MVTMRTLSFAAICLGILFLLLAGVETLLKTYVLQIHPLSFIILAGVFFLLAISIISFDRAYRRIDEKRK